MMLPSTCHNRGRTSSDVRLFLFCGCLLIAWRLFQLCLGETKGVPNIVDVFTIGAARNQGPVFNSAPRNWKHVMRDDCRDSGFICVCGKR